MDTTDEWIRDRTGIERRHIAAEGETTVDLAEHAARRALEAAGVDRRRKSTSSPSAPPRRIWSSPTAACCCRQRLGARGVPGLQRRDRLQRLHLCAVDRRQVREGGRGQVRAGGRRRNALAHHRLDRSRHRRAVCRRRRRRGARSRRPSRGILSTHLHADGSYKSCCIAAAASRAVSDAEARAWHRHGGQRSVQGGRHQARRRRR